jgi:hypothetical protein
MTLFAYLDDASETCIACVCGHTCGPDVVCNVCQPQPTLRRCRACKRGGVVIADVPANEPPPPDPIVPPMP